MHIRTFINSRDAVQTALCAVIQPFNSFHLPDLYILRLYVWFQSLTGATCEQNCILLTYLEVQERIHTETQFVQSLCSNLSALLNHKTK